MGGLFDEEVAVGALIEKLKQNKYILADGAFGTQLQARGLGPGDCPELWNETHPDVVSDIHAAYAQAGAELITTNSFGGSPAKLDKYHVADQVTKLNRMAAQLAADAAPGCLIMGSVGPCGQMLPPMGMANADTLRDGFKRQIAGLIDGGVDLILLETFLDVNEACLALQAARQIDSRIDLAATVTFNSTPRGFFTLMGVTPADAMQQLVDAGVMALGSNCGNGGEQMAALCAHLVEATDLPLIIQANAGLPELVNGETVFKETPEQMAHWAGKIMSSGARIIGGCCGSTPSHIQALRVVVDGR